MFNAVWKRAALGVSTAALAFGVAANANALEIGCYNTPERVADMKAQMVKENQAPIIKFYVGTSEKDNGTPVWTETIISMNPLTQTGHRISKDANGSFCVHSNMSSMKLIDNSRAEPNVADYMTVPGANAEKTGINRFLHASAKVDKELPMLRANEDIPHLKMKAVTYIVANNTTGKGGIFMASAEGKLLVTKVIPSPASEKVAHGAIYTTVGRDILGQSVAGITASPTLVAQRDTAPVRAPQ